MPYRPDLPKETLQESQAETVITVCAVFGAMTFVIISLRLFTRIWVIRSVGLDDILMTIAALLSWSFIVTTTMAVRHGLGNHIELVMERGLPNLTQYAQIVWLSSLFYNACLAFIKSSVLALYTRLGDRQLKKLAIWMGVIVAAQGTANVLTCIFQCSPIRAAWDATLIKTARCVDINAFYLANAALNITTDLLTYTLPIRLVMHLQLPRKQKVALGVMLCLGLFACISSCIRITFIPKMLKSQDITWDITGAMYWSVIETNIGILAASIPSFKALAKKYAPRILGEYSSRNKANTPSAGHSFGGAAGPFHKISGSKGSNEKNAVKMGTVKTLTMSSDESDSDSGRKDKEWDMGMRTTIIQNEERTESQEALHVPGKIVATTHISSRFDFA